VHCICCAEAITTDCPGGITNARQAECFSIQGDRIDVQRINPCFFVVGHGIENIETRQNLTNQSHVAGEGLHSGITAQQLIRRHQGISDSRHVGPGRKSGIKKNKDFRG
jgi:hypothetical protein